MLRPRINEESNEDIELSNEWKNNTENSEQEGGDKSGSTVTDTENKDQNQQQSSMKESLIRQLLETRLNSGYITLRNSTQRMTVNAIDKEYTECIYSTETIFNPNAPNDTEEAFKGSEKYKWRK